MSIPRVGGIPQTLLEQLREAGARIAELEAELLEWHDYFGCESPHDVYLVNSSTDHMIAGKEQERANRLEAKNALLRKALRDVRPSCRAEGCWCPEYLGYADDRRHSDACIIARAALARIPEAKL